MHGVGLDAAQGVLLTEPFYWNLNAGTREFSKRFAARFNGVVPGSVHAGQYSAVTHYLKAALRWASTRRRPADVPRSSR